LSALDRPIELQKLQHLDQILPDKQESSSVHYTTVRLRYVDKCREVYISTFQSNEKKTKIANFVITEFQF